MEQDASGSRGIPLPKLGLETPLPEGMPVSGGWGYTRDEPCIITDDREPDPDSGEARGLDHAIFFIRERLLLELNAMELERPLARIKWKIVAQELIRSVDGRPLFDHYKVNLSAFDRDGLHAIEREAGERGQEDSVLRGRSSRLSIDREYWFDVTRVPGIPDDAGMYMTYSSGMLEAAHGE